MTQRRGGSTPRRDRCAQPAQSIALYFYSETRPHHEITAEHGTYYVGRALPEWCRVGAELNSEQVEWLRAQALKREDWISYLYDREVR